MFTGIIERCAEILSLEPCGERVRLELEVGSEIAGELRIGDSVAIDGCCLTVTAAGRSRVSVEMVPETLQRTVLGARRPGDRVNLERALRADGRLDGHIVQGHVDGTGVVLGRQSTGDDVRVRIRCPDALLGLLVPKGSVAVDGVSLTIADCGPDYFEVALIPHTLAVTTLGERREGDPVNLEADVIGKYVRRYLERIETCG
ncbi:MAG: riboflavin synthase [Myxococcota bacterium]